MSAQLIDKILQYVGGSITGYATNTNGSYWKFSDGTLVCAKTWSGTVNMTAAYGSMYETASAVNFGNWPHKFATVPFIQYSCVGGGAMAFIERVTGTSITGVGTSYLISPASRTNMSVSFQFLAIGRWEN